ncbi:unnamed protein product [Clonostachys rosea f. rosea IK726]|jgi:U2-associated protein SR140|uniref:CID domain-containing protein n=2 Tax=Bionectria ochroleuca TaxID=29856 RepID=A0A0B7KHR8_BIOOC|nr:unnamed protein product [Clonostachys rosea f. rosea IK726]
MPPDQAPHEFPNVKAKLQKPTRQSAFEKQKAEAEAKRLREEAETAAVYQDFIKSFDREESGDGNEDNGRRPTPFGSQGFPGPRPGLGGPAPGTSKRHFGAPNVKSGPGSLGPAPSSFAKKRSYQDMSRGLRDRHDDFDRSSLSVPKAFRTSDDEDEEMGGATDKAEEKAIARPTLRLLNLPSLYSQAAIRSKLPSNLVVEEVNFQNLAGAGNYDTRVKTAIVTLSKETPANDIDAAVSSLQNEYLGWGQYLSLHRHLSSAVTSASALTNLPGSGSESHPFGAKPVEQPSDSHSTQRDSGFQRGFAPPSNYDREISNVSRGKLLHVPVKPPDDIRILRLINKTIEQVLDYGPEIEALLMSRPEVQREEKWAWIWDARCPGGVWYRWRLWEIVTGSGNQKKRPKYVPLFDGGSAWKVPEQRLPFEYTTTIDEFVSDSEYNSSDDEDFDGEGNRDNQGDEKEKSFLNPLEKAKLTHLLARLPPTMSKLRKGDIARVTNFAIAHASRGVDEVVDMMVSNIEKPFSMTMANRDRSQDKKEGSAQGTAADENNAADAQDASAASLVGLYAVGDILSSSSSSGVRHAWRFRQLFEVALRNRKVFERLGMMAEKFNWGRLRAEKWKRSVHLVLSLWEGWCVFAAESQDLFVQSFETPPSAKSDEKPDEGQKKNKWKVVEQNQTQETGSKSPSVAAQGQTDQVSHGKPGEPMEEDDVGGEPIEDEDIEGEPIDEDELEGQPIDDDDIEGVPIEEDDIEGEALGQEDLEPMGEDTVRTSHASSHSATAGDKGPADKVLTESKGEPSRVSHADLSRPKGVGRKPRMRAVDMFADSDSDGGS